jgi:mono/diheme cytochrome c family protein
MLRAMALNFQFSTELQLPMIQRILMPLALTLLSLTPAMAASPDEQRGKTFALTNCARCHSVDKVTPSPLKIAPPFRTLHKRYPIETIAEALAEGIVTGHPSMPQFQLDPDQIHDLLAYLKTLE